MSLKLVIFDVDGLLLDTERIWQEVWKDLAVFYQLKISGNKLFEKVVGLSGPVVHEVLEHDLQGICSSDEFLKKAEKEGLKRLKTQLKVKPGVYDILRELREREISCAVATSTCRLLTDERLKRVRIYDYFDYICCGDEVKNKKPSPDIYLKVLNKMNIKKEEALIFEDSNIGIRAAKCAGIPYVIVPDIVEPNQELVKSSLAVIPTLSLGMKIIERLI